MSQTAKHEAHESDVAADPGAGGQVTYLQFHKLQGSNVRNYASALDIPTMRQTPHGWRPRMSTSERP